MKNKVVKNKLRHFASDIYNRRKRAGRDGSYGAPAMKTTSESHREPTQFVPNKRGQLTVFIVVGIVLLFSAALIIYIRQSVEKYQPPTEIPFEQVPTELQPLQRYVTECLNRVSLEAVQKAGLQGGYTDTSSFRVNDLDPTQGNAISFSPGSDLAIPYWWYLSSGNNCEGNCQFSTERPDLKDIEIEISSEVERRLKSCVGNFEEFLQQGAIIQEGTINVTTIAGRTVTVFVNYPISVRIQGRESGLSKFASQLQIDLQKIYEFASVITNVELNYNFLETQTIHLISGFSGIKKSLPPIADSDIGTENAESWFKSEVKGNVQTMLVTFIPALQVVGNTNYVEPKYSDPFKQGVYGIMRMPFVDANGNHFTKFSSEFIYFDWWPIYFDIKGRGVTGEFITAETASSTIFSFFGLKRYNNYYDVSYPVLIEIRDDTALNGNGYTFLFALEVNLRNNKPITINYRGLPQSPLGGSLFCNQNQRNSGNITIQAKDGITNTPLSDVLIAYSCGENSCEVGFTESDGGLKSKLPICAGGSIVPSKNGYRGASIKYNAEIGKSDSLNVNLYPLYNKKIIIKKKSVYKVCGPSEIQTGPFQSAQVGLGQGAGYLSEEEQRVEDVTEKCYWFFNNAESPLLNNEMAVVTLTKVLEPGEEEYIVTIVHYGNETFTTADLVPGRYEVNVNLIYNIPAGGNNLIIRSRKIITPDTNWILPGGTDTIDLEEIKFDKAFPEGGLEIDSSNRYWELTPNNLYNNNAAVIYALKAPDFQIGSDGALRNVDGNNLRHEDLAQSANIDDYTDKLRDHLEPTYVSP